MDQKLDKGVMVPVLVDPMMELVARLGLEHEKRQLKMLKSRLNTVIEIPYDWSVGHQDADLWRASIEHAQEATLKAIGDGADAVFQAVFYQNRIPDAPFPVGFQGFADFLVRSGIVWEVWDTKLARSAKDTALVQLASYVDQLQRLGVEFSQEIHLILGDGTHSVHDVSLVMPAYLEQRQLLLQIMHERIDEPEPTPWGDERYVACGTQGCAACSEQIVLHDDLFLIAGLRKTQRDKLRVAGFHTITDFAAASRNEVRNRIYGIGLETLAMLHTQASLQVASRAREDGRPAYQVLNASVLDQIPPPNPGDVFFDFEGDPTYQEYDGHGRPLGSLESADQSVWFGLEYLFGLWGEGLSPRPKDRFLGLWAESFDQEKAVLEFFCELMIQRLEKYPGMHIYHYASYERTRLAALAARHNTCQDQVARLLDGVLVDLYPIVMKGVRIGLPSYSLKALEALYFEPEQRWGIAGGGESVLAFSNYLTAQAQGPPTLAEELQDSIVQYNRLDCLSTEALRDWLLEIKA
jgi:uncharacterized protein